ncbi:ATP-binding cassette sub-family A member 13-like [Erpetoichthys calabaricus]|uniref:ATP-binding cassette sub-family A member 13-like n=1 Tax=Erpetoichthys calabaricus TaxID=27687 RepID=UPI002234D3B0|nr:ATP-binding cassette sub-family A member 13-like [Erpetoichthys calabaricus]
MNQLQILQMIFTQLLDDMTGRSKVFEDILCTISICSNSSASQLIYSSLEFIDLASDIYKNSLSVFSKPQEVTCETLVHSTLNLLRSLDQFLYVLDSLPLDNCECQISLEKLQRQTERITLILVESFPQSPLVQVFNMFKNVTDLNIESCIKNSSELKIQLREMTNLSLETIETVLAADFNLSKFTSGLIVLTLATECNEETFRLLLSFSSDKDISTSVSEMCSMSPEEQYKLVLLFVQHLDIRNLIYQGFIPPTMKEILNQVLNIFQSITGLASKARPIFKWLPSFLSSLDSQEFINTLHFQEDTDNIFSRMSTQGSWSKLSAVVCKNLTPAALTDSQMLSDLPQITELSDSDLDKYSIPANSTPFCRQFYKDILQSPNGALLWTFMKPLLHGKILFAPHTPEIQRVMEKANDTFKYLEQLLIYSQNFLKVSDVLGKRENPLMINHLQGALENNFIHSFIESQLNIDLNLLSKELWEYETTINATLKNSVAKKITRLSRLMVNISDCLSIDRMYGFKSQEELELKATQLMEQNNFLASVIFQSPENHSTETRRSSNFSLPAHVKYTIRTNVLNSMRTDRLKNPVWTVHPKSIPATSFRYNRIFIPLQDMIENAIIAVQTGRSVVDHVTMVQSVPYPCHFRDRFLNNIGFFFPLLMMMAWMISVASMVRKLVYERELQLEVYTEMMGVKPATHICAWFLECLIILASSSAILVFILKMTRILPLTDGFLLYLFLMDFGVSTIAFSYFISAFFSSANVAALSATLLYIITFFPFMILIVVQSQLSFALQTIIGLLSTTAFSQGIYFTTLLETKETGIQWSNIYSSQIKGEVHTFGWLFWLILIDSILYAALGWYFRKLFPGKYRTKKPWYFLFRVKFWRKILQSKDNRIRSILPSNMFICQQYLQDQGSLYTQQSGKKSVSVPVNSGIVLKSLTKEYKGTKKAAIKDLNVTFSRGHITSLLGPNGAGKTTTISILTGLLQPSSGEVYVEGLNMQLHLSAARRQMGVCLQHDVLFQEMTIREHLIFYGSIKAPHWEKSQLNAEVNRAVDEVGLRPHLHKTAGDLSGGTRRKLSIAIAFIGNSSMIILDEPTDGVDPCARRGIWDVLLKNRVGRTIVLTTHHLDEAEVLSDQIAIMDQGQLKCCGSPSNLKEMHGKGNSLTLTKKHLTMEGHSLCDERAVMSLIQQHIPQAYLKGAAGGELSYIIPTSADKAAYSNLFQALDENLERLHLLGYGISDTTLEEVFLNLLHDPEIKLSMPPPAAEAFSVNSTEPINEDALTGIRRETGVRRILRQITALLIKRFHHSRRDWKGAIANILLPVLFVTMAMALFTVKPLVIDYPSLRLTPQLYNSSNLFFSSDGYDQINITAALLNKFGGAGSCENMAAGNEYAACLQHHVSTDKYHNLLCECASNNQETTKKNCPPLNISLHYLRNHNGDVLYNLSGHNLEEYLLQTSFRPPNQKYGGWSFGLPLHKELRQSLFNSSHVKTLNKVWYSQQGYHAEPSYLNQMNNFILWSQLPPGTDWTQFGISLYSQPYGGSLLDEDRIQESIRQCGVSMCILLGFSIVTASISTAIVRDRVSGNKRVQHISGLHHATYWFANFLYDMVFYLIPVGLCVSIFAAFQLSAFTFRQNLAATALLLMLFGFATLPWMYLVSRFFSSPDVAFIVNVSINFVLGLGTVFFTFLPRFLAFFSNKKVLQTMFDTCRQVFIVLPQFCLGQGLIELSYNQMKFDLTNNFGVDSYVSPFRMDFLGWILVSMSVQGCLFLLLRLSLHWDFIRSFRMREDCTSSTLQHPACDKDVEEESLRILNGKTSNDVVILHNLKKYYQQFNKRIMAVNGISLGVSRGECFGLLGVNGAGKTTTFKMLTGDLVPSSGYAVIKTAFGEELNIMAASSAGTLIGYCPQNNALEDLLTGWEHLYYYCRLHGIPEQSIKSVAQRLIQRLHLTSHIDKLVGSYSGGTKRKLSVALALVGNPQVLLLDEPSSGMDPVSKRHLWKTVSEEVQSGCAAVLTSHSMEECEALCTRLAIMVNGHFKCFGSPQHIKNRFGGYYSVNVWLSRESNDQNSVSQFLSSHFAGTYLKEQHRGLLEYQVPKKEGGLAEMFRLLEMNKESLKIEGYSITQMTLDQVFINFALQQKDASECEAESKTPQQGMGV